MWCFSTKETIKKAVQETQTVQNSNDIDELSNKIDILKTQHLEEIENLKQNFKEEHSKDICDLTFKIAELTNDNEALNDIISKEMNGLKDTIKASMDVDLKERNNKVEKLNNTIETLCADVETAHVELDEKEVEIQKLKALLEQRYDASEMEKALSNIKEKDEKIRKLEMSRLKQVGKCEKIEKELEQEKRLREELEKKLKNTEAPKAKRNNRKRATHQEIMKLQNQVERYQKKIKDAENEIKSKTIHFKNEMKWTKKKFSVAEADMKSRIIDERRILKARYASKELILKNKIVMLEKQLKGMVGVEAEPAKLMMDKMISLEKGLKKEKEKNTVLMESLEHAQAEFISHIKEFKRK